MNSYLWKITSMMTLPTSSKKSNVVVSVSALITGLNEDNPSITASQNINVELSLNDNFTNYSDLTENQVLQWVKTILSEEGVNNIEKNIDKKIELILNNQITPLAKELPWL
jgi:predicted signal transduction protein with EAL and GGDEF domain